MTRDDDRGQSTIELALSLPVLLILLLGAVQVTVVARAQLAVIHAAHEAARAASISASPSTAAALAAREAVDLTPLDVHTTTDATRVHVEVRATVPTDVPLVGSLVHDITVSADATMVLDP